MATNGKEAPALESRQGGAVGEISKLLQKNDPSAAPEQRGSRPARKAPPPPAPATPPPDEDDDAPATAAELLAGKTGGEEAPDDEAAPSAAPGDADAAASPASGALDVKALAERLDMRPADLYKQLSVALPDGRGAVSLGELKEAYTERARLEDGREALDTERADWANQAMVARRELATLAQVISAQVGPDALQPILAHARASNDEYLRGERAAMLTRFPEWKDETTFNAARDEMVAHLAPFGFDRGDLQAVADHRLVAYVYANMQRDKRIARSRAKLEAPPAGREQRAPDARRARPSASAARTTRLTRRARETGRKEDILAGVGALIEAQE